MVLEFRQDARRWIKPGVEDVRVDYMRYAIEVLEILTDRFERFAAVESSSVVLHGSLKTSELCLETHTAWPALCGQLLFYGYGKPSVTG